MKRTVRAFRWAALGAALGLAGAASVAWHTVMPGARHPGTLPPLSGSELELKQRLRAHVGALAANGERNLFAPQALEAAARYIEGEAASLGLPLTSHEFDTKAGRARNIEVRIGGRSAGLLVIGAHYDTHSGSPGANDNATGVAAALELARLLRGGAFEQSLAFVWFANEEWPFFRTADMGSRRYAQALAAAGERVVGMFSLETIGYYSDVRGSQRYPAAPLALIYPDRGDFVAFVANLASRGLLRDSVRAFRRHGRLPSEGISAPAFIEGIAWSDHASFWDEGYPALMITDTAPFRYPWYHLPEDTPDRIDFDRLARVVWGLHGMLHDLAGPGR
jgi:hypothetical protein